MDNNKTLNNMTYDIIELAGASGRLKGIASTLQTIIDGRIHKADMSKIAIDLNDISNQIDSALSTLRHTVFPMEQMRQSNICYDCACVDQEECEGA